MAKEFFLFLIRFYRVYLSPMKLPCCRYVPTCSEYAAIAVEKYGAAKGGWLAVKQSKRNARDSRAFLRVIREI